MKSILPLLFFLISVPAFSQGHYFIGGGLHTSFGSPDTLDFIIERYNDQFDGRRYNGLELHLDKIRTMNGGVFTLMFGLRKFIFDLKWTSSRRILGTTGLTNSGGVFYHQVKFGENNLGVGMGGIKSIEKVEVGFSLGFNIGNFRMHNRWVWDKPIKEQDWDRLDSETTLGGFVSVKLIYTVPETRLAMVFAPFFNAGILTQLGPPQQRKTPKFHTFSV